MPASNAPLRALDGWGARDYLCPVELCATHFWMKGVWKATVIFPVTVFEKYKCTKYDASRPPKLKNGPKGEQT